MIGIEEQLSLFKLIGEHLKKGIECIVVGGSAMLFYGMKSATKDIDIIFHSDKDRKTFSHALRDVGFSERTERIKIESKTEIRKFMPVVFERKEARVDLFSGGLFNFRLSSGIRGRLREKHEFGRLIVWIISPEDIVLFKSVTDREGDRVDAKNMIEKLNVNWETILKESSWQTENGNNAFTVFLFDFLEDLAERFGCEIPRDVVKRVRKISEREMLKVLKARQAR
jgi:hypothetical protein